MSSHASSPVAGFSLVEALVAAGLIVTALASLAEIVALSAESTRASRRSMAATMAATAKIEQLRALAWTFDGEGTPVSDFTTDTGTTPPRSQGGRGLSSSPPGTLEAAVPGWVDYVDEAGAPLGSGSDRPPGAVFMRRWATRPLDLVDTIVIEVCVVRLVADPLGEPRPEICLATIRARQP